MVRHEAADAISSLGNASHLDVLKQYIADSSDIVADTCIVAVSKLKEELAGGVQLMLGAS